MGNFLKIFILLAGLHLDLTAQAQNYQADANSLEQARVFIEGLNERLNGVQSIFCSTARQRGEEISINSPVCNYQDICNSVKRENGYLKLNGVSMPDYLLKNKLERLRNRVAFCYDRLSNTGNFNNAIAGYLMIDLLGGQEQARRFNEQVQNSILDVVEAENSGEQMILPQLTPTRLEQYITQEDTSEPRLDSLLAYLRAPNSEQAQAELLAQIQNTGLRQNFSAYLRQESVSQRQLLLNRFESLKNLEGFSQLDRRPEASDFEELSALTETMRTELLERVRQRNIDPPHRDFFEQKILQSRLVLGENFGDEGCDSSYGPPAFVRGTQVVLCPKALSIPKEGLMGIIGHELAHLIDPCNCTLHNYFLMATDDPRGAEFNLNAPAGVTIAPPNLNQYPFDDTLSCIRETNIVDVRMFDPNDASLGFEGSLNTCFPQGASDQAGESFADMVSVNLNRERLNDFTLEQAQSYVISLALTKPYICEENENFKSNEYYREIEEIEEYLNSNPNCQLPPNSPLNVSSESELYDDNGPHLSMEERVNHIYMNEVIQQKLGCESEDGAFANSTLSCDF